MHFPFEFEYPRPRQGRALDITAVIGLDAAGKAGIVALEVDDGRADGLHRVKRGPFFERVEAFLRTHFWDDVLAQVQSRRREHARAVGLAEVARRAMHVGSLCGLPLTDAEFRRAGELLEQFETRAEMLLAA